MNEAKVSVEISTVATHPENGSTLKISFDEDAAVQFLIYEIGDVALRHAQFQGFNYDPTAWPLILAEYDFPSKVLTTYPTYLDPGTRVFAQQKYRKIRSISFDEQPPLEKREGWPFGLDLPTGFIRDPFSGLGLDPRIKYIVQALEEVEGVTGITLSGGDGPLIIRGTDVYMPEWVYHEARLNINRAHDAAVSFANGEKLTYLKNRFLPHLVEGHSGPVFERPVGDLQGTVRLALSKRGVAKSRNSTAAAALRTVTDAAESLAKDDPVQLFALSEKLELVTLDGLIARTREAIAAAHKEAFWQEFFKLNPFIFKMLFGLPVVIYADQASVGGMGHHRHGEKYADFLLEAGASKNLAIVEIKTPSTPLMHSSAYREPTLYRPHSELVGGLNQVLEQRYNLVASIHNKRSVDETGIQAWSVPCFLIVGTTPSDRWMRQSFELFRGNQRDVVIITFDELLAKMTALHSFLMEKGPT